MFPQRLKKLRLKQDLTLDQFSKRVKIKKSLLSKFENGEIIPNVDDLVILCKGLNCSPNDLLGYSGKIESILDSGVLDCAKIIQSMGSIERKWAILTVEGIQLKIENAKKFKNEINSELLNELIQD